MTIFTAAIEQASDILWNSLLLFLLVGTGVFFTIRLRGVQLRRFGEGFHRVFGNFTLRGKKADDQGMSSFQALATAIAAQVGTGNITGCATALVSGGPGALFWMWLAALFGMATKYSETFAAVKYRVKDHNGNMLGGAMYAWRRAFEKDGKTPWWGLLGAGAFALFAAIASFGIGSAVQSSAMTGIIMSNFPGIPAWGIGLAIVIMVSIVIFGGVKVIGVVPNDTHKKIIYPAAVCTDSKQAEAAAEFLDWATTDADAKKLWQEWGFELVTE